MKIKPIHPWGPQVGGYRSAIETNVAETIAKAKKAMELGEFDPWADAMEVMEHNREELDIEDFLEGK